MEIMNQDHLLAELFSALGHPNRVRIIEFLRDGERCQCELLDGLQLEQSNISRHVKILISAGILRSRKDGTKTMLRVSDPRLLEIINESRGVLFERLTQRLEALKF